MTARKEFPQPPRRRSAVIVAPRFQPPFVRSDAARLTAGIVIRPAVALERQTPTHGEPSPIAARFDELYDVFMRRLRAAGVETLVVDPVERLPLASLVSDTAVVFSDGAFLMRPSDPARRLEIDAMRATLEAAGVPIVGRITSPGLLDGGDVMVTSDTLFIGVAEVRAAQVGLTRAVRSNAAGRAQLAAYAGTLGLRLVEVAVAASAPRLRSVASLIDTQTLLYAPALVETRAFTGLELIDVPEGEDVGAGVLALGNRRVIANLRFTTMLPRLRKAKFAVDAIDLWEFGKIGATPSSLVLPIKRG